MSLAQLIGICGALAAIATAIYAVPKICRGLWAGARWLASTIYILDRFTNVARDLIALGEEVKSLGGHAIVRQFAELHHQLMPPGGKCIMVRMQSIEEINVAQNEKIDKLTKMKEEELGKLTKIQESVEKGK